MKVKHTMLLITDVLRCDCVRKNVHPFLSSLTFENDYLSLKSILFDAPSQIYLGPVHSQFISAILES